VASLLRSPSRRVLVSISSAEEDPVRHSGRCGMPRADVMKKRSAPSVTKERERDPRLSDYPKNLRGDVCIAPDSVGMMTGPIDRTTDS
jgi:hypothetical protein